MNVAPDTRPSTRWMHTSCREAAALLSARRDPPLDGWRSLALAVHLRSCGRCREAARQWDAIDALAARWLHGDGEDLAQR
jgi:Putative zinc-finger